MDLFAKNWEEWFADKLNTQSKVLNQQINTHNHHVNMLTGGTGQLDPAQGVQVISGNQGSIFVWILLLGGVWYYASK